MTALLLLLLACTGPDATPEPVVDAVAQAPTEAPAAPAPGDAQAPPVDLKSPAELAATGGSCLSDADCGEGDVCEGLGCGDDAPGACMSGLRPCTADLRPYCGCDGVTFMSSGSCPGRRYQAAGACAGDAPGEGGPQGGTIEVPGLGE